MKVMSYITYRKRIDYARQLDIEDGILVAQKNGGYRRLTGLQRARLPCCWKSSRPQPAVAEVKCLRNETHRVAVSPTGKLWFSHHAAAELEGLNVLSALGSRKRCRCWSVYKAWKAFISGSYGGTIDRIPDALRLSAVAAKRQHKKRWLNKKLFGKTDPLTIKFTDRPSVIKGLFCKTLQDILGLYKKEELTSKHIKISVSVLKEDADIQRGYWGTSSCQSTDTVYSKIPTINYPSSHKGAQGTVRNVVKLPALSSRAAYPPYFGSEAYDYGIYNYVKIRLMADWYNKVYKLGPIAGKAIITSLRPTSSDTYAARLLMIGENTVPNTFSSASLVGKAFNVELTKLPNGNWARVERV